MTVRVTESILEQILAAHARRMPMTLVASTGTHENMILLSLEHDQATFAQVTLVEILA